MSFTPSLIADSSPPLTHPVAALALSLLKPKSPKALYQALRECGSAENLLNQPATLLPLLTAKAEQQAQYLLDRPLESELFAQVSHILERLNTFDSQVLALGQAHYPSLLAQTHDAPPLLYVRGDPNALHLPSIAIVGARHCTAQGGENAYQFARDLARGGFVITSGLALGIDSHAHRGALAASGITVAVMATGIDRLYPASNQALGEEILANGGCLVSEFPLGAKPLRPHFPQRNRIISGLSGGTLVVEAKVKSGSLITARLALRQNREVFAIPGSIHNPLAKGCHQLIRDGAKLTETSDDIVEELGALLDFKRNELNSDQAPAQTQTHPLLDLLGYQPMAIDELASRAQIPIDQLMVDLLTLELDGKIAQVDGIVERLHSS